MIDLKDNCRYIDPKTGEYITKEEFDASINIDLKVMHFISTYGGSFPFLVKMRKYIRENGISGLTLEDKKKILNCKKPGQNYRHVNSTLIKYKKGKFK